MRIKIEIAQELLIIVGLSALLMLMIYVFQAPALRLGLGLAYVLFLPGYATLAALFPGKDDLPGVERVTLSFVLSMAIVSLIALGLNFTPWGVRLGPVLVSVGSFILLACGVGYYRRVRLRPAERFIVCLESELPRWRAVAPLDRMLGAALGLSVLFAGATVLYFLVNPKVSERYTEFYLLGPSGKLGEYPTEVLAGTPITVTVGVVNHEHGDVQYRIERGGSAGKAEITTLQLVHEETWEQAYTFTLTEPGENHKVTFLLYRGDDEEPYRSLHLWITVKEKPSAQ